MSLPPPHTSVFLPVSLLLVALHISWPRGREGDISPPEQTSWREKGTVHAADLVWRGGVENLRIPAWITFDSGPQPLGGGLFRYSRVVPRIIQDEFHWALVTGHNGRSCNQKDYKFGGAYWSTRLSLMG